MVSDLLVLGPRTIEIDADLVLAAEGVRPTTRVAPAVLEAASQAARKAPLLIDARFASAVARVMGRDGSAILLDRGELAGESLAEELREAEFVAGVVCTIGPRLEALALATLPSDPVLALAFDAAGSAACERLAAMLVEELTMKAQACEMGATGRIMPGMDGWPLAGAQRQLFALVDAAAAGVELTPSAQMLPRKSLSFLVGLGTSVTPGPGPCERCGANDRCRFRAIHA